MIPQFFEIKSSAYFGCTNLSRANGCVYRSPSIATALKTPKPFAPSCPFRTLIRKENTRKIRETFVSRVVAAWSDAIANSFRSYASLVPLNSDEESFNANDRPQLPSEIELTKKAFDAGLSADKVYSLPANDGPADSLHLSTRYRDLSAAVATHALEQILAGPRNAELARAWAQYAIPEGVDTRTYAFASSCIKHIEHGGLIHVQFEPSPSHKKGHGILQFAYMAPGAVAVAIYCPNAPKVLGKRGVSVGEPGDKWNYTRGTHTIVITNPAPIAEPLTANGLDVIFAAPNRLASAFRMVSALLDSCGRETRTPRISMAAVLANRFASLTSLPALGSCKDPQINAVPESVHQLVYQRALTIHKRASDSVGEREAHLNDLISALETETEQAA